MTITFCEAYALYGRNSAAIAEACGMDECEAYNLMAARADRDLGIMPIPSSRIKAEDKLEQKRQWRLKSKACRASAGGADMNTAKLFLPWPEKTLSPNSRVHWSSLHRAKRKAKNDAFFAVKEAGIGKIEASSLTVRYSFYPPSHRTYDLDNLVSSMKAAADGIALAIGVDDGKWNIEISPRGPVERNGMVKVELEWAP